MFKKNDQVFKINDPSESMYLICFGQLSLYDELKNHESTCVNNPTFREVKERNEKEETDKV